MKLIRLFFAVAILLSSVNAGAALDSNPSEQWDSSTPVYPFFSNGIIRACPACQTLVVIASTGTPSRSLVEQFRHLSQRVGDDSTHEGVLMRRDQVLSNVDELTSLRCELPDRDELNVAYFIYRPDNVCIKIPYEDEQSLRIILERTYGYLDNVPAVIAQLNSVNRDRILHDYYENAKQFIGASAPYIRQILQLAIAIAQKGA